VNCDEASILVRAGGGTLEFPNNKSLGPQDNYFGNNLCNLTFYKLFTYNEKPLLLGLMCGLLNTPLN
jgi:hypothetical protein